MTSNRVFRSQSLYRVTYTKHIYHRAKFDFSSLSSLANKEGAPKAPSGYYKGQNSLGEMGLTSEFLQVVWRTSTGIEIILRADADWIFYEEYCNSSPKILVPN